MCVYACTVITYSRVVVVVVVVVSHIQRIGCQPEKTTLHGGQSRSWSAEQGKENKRKSLAAYPPPTPHTARSEKINMDQPGKVANPARGQLNQGGNIYSSVPVRA